MKIQTRTAQEKALALKKRTRVLAMDGGLVHVAKRALKDKGMVPPEGPVLVGLIIKGAEKLAQASSKEVNAIRDLGFMAMNKKREKASTQEDRKQGKRMARTKQFYQDPTIDQNLNL